MGGRVQAGAAESLEHPGRRIAFSEQVECRLFDPTSRVMRRKNPFTIDGIQNILDMHTITVPLSAPKQRTRYTRFSREGIRGLIQLPKLRRMRRWRQRHKQGYARTSCMSFLLDA